MVVKVIAAVLLLTSFTLIQPPQPVYASFFLINIIKGIFGSNRPMVVVKYGMKGKDVVTVQNYLVKSGYLKGSVDGIFGTQTLKAVQLFQKENHLQADGVVGQKTFDALKNYSGTRNVPVSKSHSKKPLKAPIPSGIPAYRYALTMVATAYTRYDEGCSDYTYRGNYLRKGLVAVDPAFVALGTKLYIPGYGYAIADDIGGAIQGNRIDLAMDTLDEAFRFGVQEITVYVLL